VALLAPLSGRAQAVGQGLLEAAQLAVFDHAPEGFKLLPFDTEKDGATAAVAAAVNAGAHIIIGPLFAAQVTEVAPIAKAAGLSVISFSNDRSAAQSGVYVLGLSPVQALQRVLAITREKGLTRYAALVPDAPIGRQLTVALERTLPQAGGSLVRADTYPASATDFQGIVRRTAEYDRRRAVPPPPPSYQALVIGELSVPRLKQMGPWIPYYDIDVKDVRLIGMPQWDDTSLGAEPGFVGAWYAAPDPAGRAPFEEKYKATYTTAPNRLSSLAYDAVALTAVIGKLTNGPNFSDSTLTNPNGFAGVEGLFRLNTDGSTERGLAVWEIQRGAHKQIAPAPGSFLPPTN
jgi:branched-chain amino acid transport system substrate-binding protein